VQAPCRVCGRGLLAGESARNPWENLADGTSTRRRWSECGLGDRVTNRTLELVAPIRRNGSHDTWPQSLWAPPTSPHILMTLSAF